MVAGGAACTGTGGTSATWPLNRRCFVQDRATMPEATITRSANSPYKRMELIATSEDPVRLLINCKRSIAPPTINNNPARTLYSQPFTRSPARNACRANTRTGPVDASMARAWVQLQALESCGLWLINWPFCRKSAALTMIPAASRGSLVMATNLKMKLMVPAYQLSDTNDCHLGCLLMDSCIDP